MFDFLEKIRQKPERTKKQIAFLGAFLFSGIIFIVWLSVIYPDFKQKQEKKVLISTLEPSPLETFKETFSVGLFDIGKQFSELKNSVYSFTSEFISSEGVATSSKTQKID